MLFTWVLSLLVAVVHCSAFKPAASWENTELVRSIDLAKSYIKEHYELTIKNIDVSPINEYYFALPNYVFDKMSGYTFSSGKRNSEPFTAEIIEDVTTINNEPLIRYIKIQLPHPVAPKSTYKLTADFIIVDMTEPLPAKIEIDETQTLLLRTFKRPLSAYKTLSSKIVISGMSDAQELPVAEKPIEEAGKVADGAITYKFDEDIEAFTVTPLPLVFTHNVPLTKITELERNVWISHWANSIQFEEFYKMTNKAAQLKSGFSRADFMKKKQAMKLSHALTALEIPLTEEAQDIYYTDLVGNVSTSRAFPNRVYIRPRYPLFGGWNYNFTLGWSNKLDEFLKYVKGEDEYVLSVPLLNGPIDATYDKVELSFYLPEHAKFLEVYSPVDYESISEGHELSYFDMNNGHTKVSLTYVNLVDEMRQLEVIVKYKYTTLNFLQKPLDIAKFVFIGLVSYWLLTKVDVSLKSRK